MAIIKKIECQVCFEFCSKSSFPKITSNCNHKLNICKSCVSKHIASQLDSKIERINCPFDRCDRKFNNDDIKNISEELFERFDILILRQTLSKMPEFRWCKNPKCESGQIHFEEDDAPIMTCQACGQKSCYTHDIPWHEDLSCSNYEVNKQGNDEETQDLLEKETKPCPKCGIRITKDEGCDHMTCSIRTCEHEFCWLCFADYEEIRQHGNTSHEPTCKFYA
ncbi:hypothetical protein RhiirA5_398985 [Rhizophagus irregularis]|uniref:RBR-type E3 ubiquitin transferase n=3 Tax=Rhizophagus irregularis TaxID=588596 RepID=U9UBH4_RHIID|nr:hypothetical protein GLOIN_2v1846846 [Rhizophagus irregularis DAOM 181602=DAOM 197198]EXX62369.1 Hel1p [Rhizophagus irregularis DAOM 197198w]PKC08978.1 hypothetical protein RhiirA5_398985 [Rhizophagus irregularis]PKC63398.1 hypothetical protein RhiirA1_367125 [Rhizophagus irregularis]PKK70793.1 hypothetical protein RhiirC2_681254 [Rhizophagus irregularis]PKY23656.1 hypothetical protein RhiirB3_355418 [Rhizophagus irregularis]|eukprot:XP_025168655.1 hypothetical protein GLOIN_2v1846846 [Rhizophagus irregularis DAOM 181602=DAOM 197198]